MFNKSFYVTFTFLSLAFFALCKACEPSGDLRWFSIKKVCSPLLPDFITVGIQETYENSDLALYGIDVAVISQLLPIDDTPNDFRRMDLDMNLIIHECQFVVHKCKEGGQLYLQPEHPDTSVFTSPNFDNKDVAETLMNHIDTASMSEFRDGLSKYSTRYALNSKTATKATKWVLKQFKKIKRDDITVKTIKEPTTGQNSILVTITGSCAGEEENVILGAHLDSIANVEFPDMSEDDPAPGLDDDGSGVMVLFEILRVIVETGYKPHKNVQIMAYASEEVGLLGSDQIAENYESEGMKVIGMLGFDGVGYNSNTMPFDMGFTKDFSNVDHADFLGALTTEYLGLSYFYYTCGHECGDHASWYLRGYPSTMVTESDANPNYHTSKDNIIDVDYAANFAKLGVAYLAELAKGTIA